LGADFPDGDTRWWPFGHPLSENFVAATSKLPELPVAKMGFGMAAPVLELKEGKRTVTFTITSDYFEESKPINSIAPQLSVFFSGEKEWIEGEIDTAASSLQNKKLTLAVVVSEGAAAITGYDKEVLLEPYETTLPVVRFLWDQTNGNAATHGLQEFFGKSIVRDISINVAVEGLQDFVVENDQGAMDPAKPFYPFGTQPVAGSNFYIGLPETLQKKWGNITVSINWKDAPKDFASHYLAYRRDYLGNISKNTYDLTLDENGNLNSTPRTPIVDDNEYFTASVSILKNGGWDPEGTYKLFDGDAWEIEPTAKANEGAGAYKAKAAYIKYSFKNTFKKFWATEATNVKRPSAIDSFRAPQPPGRKNFSAAAKTGFVRITLNTSFLHELFPKLYSVALSKIFQDNTLIPNEPYTPMVASLTVGYTASAGKKNIQFFHEHPFGVSLEDKGRKRASVLPAAKRAIKLFPSFNQNSLYIGLENAAVQQQVSLLVQVLEGSENPEYLDDGLQLSWSILCDNEWLSLDKDFIVSNNTDNFLKTGIVTLAVPKVATTDNTKFPDGLFWVKVSSNRAYDATSQLVGVFAQAVPAQFDNRGNSLEHLEHGLGAESISKLVQRISPIKKAEQPFNSFGGAPKESNSAYYRRISERLRHKNRAIALWDYEHIVLQKFPYVYKANCLPHTSVTSSQAPGRVTVVVIPNVVNKNVYDIYKPRISTAKRNEIKDHINLLNTLHVSAQVINPDYEAVKVQVDVRFYDGYDAHFYELQLKKDITKLLSPWAFEETNSIDFGVTLHESKVIHYIEKLEYVDFISDFKMKQKTGPRFTTVRQVAATKPQGIITSVPFVQHQVTAIPKNVPCTPLKFEPVAETELEGDIEIEML
ncbi:MAG: baseplate J/gp47 family protein, partial [Marinirhabdus sp.]